MPPELQNALLIQDAKRLETYKKIVLEFINMQ
jgi:hypothetical protein